MPTIPALVGGIAVRAYDLPGSIVFAAAFALLHTALAIRLIDKRWRTILVLQPLLFCIERQILFTLRAGVAARPHTESDGLSRFMQASFTLGYLDTSETVLKLIRTVLVNSTTGTPVSDIEGRSSLAESTTPVDRPRRRFWYRRWADFLEFLFLGALAAGIIATAQQSGPEESGENFAHQLERYISSGVGLTLVLLEMFTVIWASRNIPQIDRRAVRLLLALTAVLVIPPIYRLAVMWHTTPDVRALNHDSLNTRLDKTLFYIMHLVPEWTAIFLMCLFNVREICQTGFKGDTRWWDETPKERAKRERKEREKAQKKAEAAKSRSTIELALLGNR
ncbi:hypothetical protein R3P38DRAFT_2825534 [Favolaschia claudopus]|uniref:Uncharacterized protein n=1 Tax=Favolaschia claudopus TaxID=2862362 RepID=A0AAW0EJW2_9AGAR